MSNSIVKEVWSLCVFFTPVSCFKVGVASMAKILIEHLLGKCGLDIILISHNDGGLDYMPINCNKISDTSYLLLLRHITSYLNISCSNNCIFSKPCHSSQCILNAEINTSITFLLY